MWGIIINVFSMTYVFVVSFRDLCILDFFLFEFRLYEFIIDKVIHSERIVNLVKW